ncbi:hypothetical protein JCM10207_005425 [Rhodosporidiobolus poonsookiae]
MLRRHSTAATPSTTSTLTGTLSVTLAEARNLPTRAGKHARHPSLDKFVSNVTGGKLGGSGGKKGKELAALPYVILTFDKNEIVVDAVDGSATSPIYAYTTTFDFSHSASLLLAAFHRSPHPSGTGAPASHRRAQSISAEDVLLASADADISWNEGEKTKEVWLKSSSGSGEFRLQISLQQGKNKSLTIDDFELLKVIGKGSFGKVMQVRKKDTGRIYAMKTIRKAHIVSRSEVTHTLAERTVLAQVRSAFVVPLKFCFQSKDKLYLVLSYVNGGELFHHLQREGRFSEDRSRFYAAELLSALDCLHQHDVVYRDLKPENILLDWTGHIVLCDFGLAKLNMTENERTNTFAGTPEYLAPELILGEGYTRSVDWWTLGVLLYEMLSGLPPFYEEDHQTMYKRIVSETLSFPRATQGLIRPSARDLLTSLLQKDPTKRLGHKGADEIRRHLFWYGIDWKRLEQRGYIPAWKPEVEGVQDTGNVDGEFLREPALDSVVDASPILSSSTQDQFAGFSYVGPGGMMGESVR